MPHKDVQKKYLKKKKKKNNKKKYLIGKIQQTIPLTVVSTDGVGIIVPVL